MAAKFVTGNAKMTEIIPNQTKHTGRLFNTHVIKTLFVILPIQLDGLFLTIPEQNSLLKINRIQ